MTKKQSLMMHILTGCIELVFDGRYSKKLSYQKLLKRAASNQIYLQYSDGWKSGGRWSGFKGISFGYETDTAALWFPPIWIIGLAVCK